MASETWDITTKHLRWVAAAAGPFANALNGGAPLSTDAMADTSHDDARVCLPGLLFGGGIYLMALSELAKQTVVDGKNRDWHAALILRSLYEYAVTFCWLAAEPKTRLPGWVAADRRIRLATSTEMERWGGPALPPEVRTNFVEAVADAKAAGQSVPKIEELARQADDFWLPRLPEFSSSENTKGGLCSYYPIVYRQCSQIAHPTPSALQNCFVVPNAEGGLMIATSSETSNSDFYTLGPLVMTIAILVGAQLFPWVNAAPVQQLLATKPSR